MLFAGVYVCTFQPGNSTYWGSEGVNPELFRIWVELIHTLPRSLLTGR